MFEREETFFEAHKEALRKKYPHQHLVIVGDEVWGAYAELGKATLAAMARFEPETFMIKSLDESDDEIIIAPIITYA